MPNYSRKIVYLSDAQRQELFTNNTVTVNGQTITYNDNDIYVTPQAEPIIDVKINNTSISANGVANIPLATSSTPGLVKAYTAGGVSIFTSGTYTGCLYLPSPNDETIKAGVNGGLSLKPCDQHKATFYGLAKVAGVDMKNSNNEIGTYTDEAKAAIQNMLGVTSLFANEEFSTATAAHSANSLFMMDGKLHKATTAIGIGNEVTAGLNCTVVNLADILNTKVNDIQLNGVSIVSNGIANIPIASDNNLGLVKTNQNYGIVINPANGEIMTRSAGDNIIKPGTDWYRPITPYYQHVSVFYGLAKAAGDTTQSASSNAVGTYTADAKSAIRTMIGAGVPLDVQINGTSIVNNGIANIPEVSSGNLGLVKMDSSGTYGFIYDNIYGLQILPASGAQVKAGTDVRRPLVAGSQHKAVFYGLAKAAGDTTMASSSNAVGIYTTDAKTAIQTMLGIENGVVIVEEINGTTPTIVGIPNYRYKCGEVSTISITPPTSGSIDVRFDSGSTAAVMTVPSTVKWPEWFDAENLEANITYEILITDGVYGSVMTWA